MVKQARNVVFKRLQLTAFHKLMKDIFPRSVQRQLFAVKLQRVYHLSLSVNPSNSQLQHEASTTSLQISKALNFTSRVFSCEFLYLLTWRTARPVKAGKGSKSHTHNRKFLGVVPSMILQIEKLNINNSIHSYSERDMKWWYAMEVVNDFFLFPSFQHTPEQQQAHHRDKKGFGH